jgi:O-antigen ligase
MLNYIVYFLTAAFLLLNLAVRSYALYNQDVLFGVLLSLVGFSSLVVWRRPGSLKPLCFFLGLSLPLYGFQSYTIYNQVFEFLIVLIVSLLLFARDGRMRLSQYSGRIVGILAAYMLLALLSLQLLPLDSFVDTVALWGVLDFSNFLFPATPDNPLYSIVAGNRLVIFFLFIFLLNQNSVAEILYKKLFTGLAVSVLAACLLGLLNQFDIISLAWYRPQFLDASGADRLHSVFGNPGWFAEYVVICTPFVLLLFGRVTGVSARLLLLSIALGFIGISLLLTGSRTSWIVFLVLGVFCYLSTLLVFSGRKGLGITWRDGRRACVRVGMGVLGVCLVGVSLFLVMEQNSSGTVQGESISRTEYLLERMRTIATPKERVKLWQESLALVGERPVYGMGYEGYRWHQEVMDTIPGSRFSQERLTTINWDTAHNFFIQLAVSNGVIGLFVWSFLVMSVAFLLCLDGLKNRNLQSFVLLGALFAFHLYGFTQSMQYVTSIWFLVFLIIGYAMLLDRRLRSAWLVWCGRIGCVMAFVAVLIGSIVYGGNKQSHLLAERYGLSRYGIDRNGDQYKGFYQKENWGEDGYFRWSGRAAEIVLNGSGIVRIDFACYAPRLEQLPLSFDVRLGGQLVDQYTFRKGEKITRTYVIPAGNDHSPAILNMRLSRIWNPKREKLNSDTRNLGIAVGEPRYISMLPVIPALLLE